MNVFDVAVKVFVSDGSGNIVLIKRKYDPDAGTWDAPGGAVEFGEKLEDACMREALEETGLKIKVGSLIGVQEKMWSSKHIVFLYYWGEFISGKLAAADDAGEAKWVPLKEVCKHENLRPIFVNILNMVIKNET